jgi:DNA/RNA-binding domain of Phe-tRNA-synthetase-like protein
MEFHASSEVFARFPGLRLAGAVAHALENAVPRPDVETRWRTAWTNSAAEGVLYGNAQSHPRVKPWRDRFAALGVSGKQFPSSVEGLL